MRKNGWDHINQYATSKCVPKDRCKKPGTDVVNLLGQLAQLLDSIDVADPSTWNNLLDLLGLSDNPNANILSLLQTGSSPTPLWLKTYLNVLFYFKCIKKCNFQSNKRLSGSILCGQNGNRTNGGENKRRANSATVLMSSSFRYFLAIFLIIFI